MTSADHFYDADEGFAGGYNGSSDQQQLRLIQEQEWRAELAKLEEDIATLKTVLDAKINEASQLKRRLGITPIVEIKDDLKHSIQVIRESGTYQKTNEKLHEIGETISTSEAYVKTNAALKSFGAFATKKLSDMRNSNVFKSVEERVGEAYTNVKVQMSSTATDGEAVSFEEALRTDVDNHSAHVTQTPNASK